MVRLVGGKTGAALMPDESTRPRWQPGRPTSPEALVVSIGLPVRNGDRRLERAVRSVFSTGEHLFNSTETMSEPVGAGR